MGETDMFCGVCGASQDLSTGANPFAVGSQTSGDQSYVNSSGDAPEIPSFGRAISICFRKFCDFSGRASRSEFWWWTLFTTILRVVVAGVLGALATAAGANPDSIQPIANLGSNIVNLAMLLPSLAVAARRLHDTDRSAWWLLLMFVPLIGWIVLLIFYVTPSKPGPNRFGKQPQRR